MGKQNGSENDNGGEGNEQPKTVDIPEADTGSEESTEQPVLSLSDLAEGGFSKEELEMAEKQGLVKPKGEGDGGTEGDKGGDAGGGKGGGTASTTGNDGKSKVDGGEDGKTKEGEKRKEPRDGQVLIDGKTPEQILADMSVDFTPEQEKFLEGVLNSNAFGLYRGQRRERRARQAAESERDSVAKQKDAEIAELRKKLAEVTGKTEDDDLLEPDPNADPKKKPLTQEDLERIEKEKQDKLAEDNRIRTERATQIKEVLDDQQEEARERYEDFDQTLENTGALIKAANDGKLAELFPDPRERSKMERDIRILLASFANADKFKPGDYNAADMAYELGKKMPANKNKDAKANASGSKRGETDVDGNSREKAERALQNANRRGSSAALNGGGSRRAVNLDELTEEQALRLPTKEFNKLPRDVRERLLGKA